MKTILVSQRLVANTGYAEVREALDIRWGNFLMQVGLLPVPVMARIKAEHYFEKFKPAGVLLTGGNDLAVFAPHDPLSVERDQVEKNLIKLAAKHQLPVVGVCRGMQMLAHYWGGGLDKKPGHAGTTHSVQFQASRMAESYPKPVLDVNSYHNYCVMDLPHGFNAVALHADKTIEAFEHRSEPIYGMMWHPERYDPFIANDIQFFKKVFNL